MFPYVIALVWAVVVSAMFGTRYARIEDRDIGWFPVSVICLAFIASIPLMYLLAFRHEVGTDYAAYVRIYEAILEGAAELRYEPLYVLLNQAMTPLGDWGIVLVFGWAAAISTVPVIWRVMHSSNVPWLSVVVLFGMTYPFLSTNVVRFVIAVAVMFFLLPTVWHKKPKVWIVGSILSAGFHYTALLMLPFYWILRRNWSIVTACVLLLLAGLLSSQKNISLLFLEIVQPAMPQTYAHYPGLIKERLEVFSFGLGYVWYTLSAIIVLGFWGRVGQLGMAERVIRNAFFIGILIMISTYQFWAVNRIGWYFWISGSLYWPIFTYRVIGNSNILFMCSVASVHIVLFVHALIIGSHDAVPYKSLVG